MKVMRAEVLDARRKKLLPRFSLLNQYGFYLAGGTALALHIGHRTSLDFDFYTNKSFDPDELYEELEAEFQSEPHLFRGRREEADEKAQDAQGCFVERGQEAHR